MADVSQVLTTFTGLVATAIYPNGTSQPSVAGVDTVIFPGWPIRNKVDEQILAGKAFVSVFPAEERIVTKFERKFSPSTIASPTLIVVVAANTITINGTVSLPQSIMAIVNGIGYGYAVQSGDTLSTIATALAALIPGASAVTNVITISGIVYSLSARISVDGTSIAELARVEQIFKITCWAPTLDVRTALGIGIRQYIDTTYRVRMVDNVYAQIFYSGTLPDDDSESKSNVFIRKINYMIQYATTATRQDMVVTDSYSNLAVNQ